MFNYSFAFINEGFMPNIHQCLLYEGFIPNTFQAKHPYLWHIQIERRTNWTTLNMLDLAVEPLSDSNAEKKFQHRNQVYMINYFRINLCSSFVSYRAIIDPSTIKIQFLDFFLCFPKPTSKRYCHIYAA